MMKMMLQNVIFPNEMCENTELYFSSSGESEYGENGLSLQAGAKVRTNTYMNLLDENVWGKYTYVAEWELKLRVKGQGIIQVYGWAEGKEELISESHICSTQFIERVFAGKFQNRKIYFQLTAKKEFVLQSAGYEGISSGKAKDIHLSLIICTYHRNDMVTKNIEILKKSKFFYRDSEYKGSLDAKIIDNGSELPKTKEKYIEIIHNSNTGGSGGFSRGITEVCKEKDKHKTTHVVFMDDDVDFIAETFYRLYALLRSAKNEYSKGTVGGRMFRKDKRQIQYTASEIWNGGNIVHVGENRDMTAWENVASMNDESGEYSGWWFACYPIEFVEKNDPLPFFLHCDDVEYGLRYGKKPIILNGIQVWHETYEYRKSPKVKYYDTRNSLIVNTLYKFFPDERTVWIECKKRLDECWNRKEYDMAYAVCAGMWEYLKGCGTFLKKGEKSRKIEIPIPFFHKYWAALFWRIVFLKYKLHGKKAFLSYRVIKEQNK